MEGDWPDCYSVTRCVKRAGNALNGPPQRRSAREPYGGGPAWFAVGRPSSACLLVGPFLPWPDADWPHATSNPGIIGSAGQARISSSTSKAR